MICRKLVRLIKLRELALKTETSIYKHKPVRSSQGMFECLWSSLGLFAFFQNWKVLIPGPDESCTENFFSKSRIFTRNTIDREVTPSCWILLKIYTSLNAQTQFHNGWNPGQLPTAHYAWQLCLTDHTDEKIRQLAVDDQHHLSFMYDLYSSNYHSHYKF